MKFLLYNFNQEEVEKISHIVSADSSSKLNITDYNNFIYDSEDNTLKDSFDEPYHLIVDSAETFLDYISQFSVITNR